MLGFSITVREFVNEVRAGLVGIVDANGAQLSGFDSSRPSTAVHTMVPYAVGSQPVLAANPARRRMVVSNPTNKTVFLFFGTTATLAIYTIPIPSNGAYEGPLNDYTGDVSVIWQSAPANGSVLHVTEITT
jgi:hypothetical protein